MIGIRFLRVDDKSGRYERQIRVQGYDAPLTDEVTIPPIVYPRWGRPFEADLPEFQDEALKDLGEHIFELALGNNGHSLLQHARQHAHGGRVPIVLEESADIPGAAAVPWELMHDGEDFLALNPRTPIQRRALDAASASETTIGKPLRVLVFWAAPTDQGRVDIEMEQIRLALALAPYKQNGDILDFEVLHCTRRKLKEALAARSYDLVYYTGHGTYENGSGYLCLEKHDGTTDLLSASEFVRMLGMQDRLPALVFLNCCLSAAAGYESALPGHFLDVGRRVLTEGVPFVIATLTPVLVSTAQDFMEVFFGTLLRGDEFDVAKAMAMARTAVLEKDASHQSERHSFFQYLLLDATDTPWRVHLKALETTPDDRAEIYYVSPEHYQLQGTEVSRNDLLSRIEQVFLAGTRAVGLYGTGGIGKTVTSVQLEHYACTHFEPRVRVDKALWLDLRGEPNLADILDQLCGILQLAHQSQLASTLREQLDPAPVPLARELRHSLGSNCLLTLDNCETLLNTDGEFVDSSLKDLTTALVCHTGWRCVMTSRERFSLAREGREVCPVRWIPVEEMGYNEAATLLRIGIKNSALSLEELDEEELRLILSEVAGHPYELRLFLKDATNSTNIAQEIAEVHALTGDYAALGYYVKKTDEAGRRMLELLALLDEPEQEALLEAAWKSLGKPRGWPANEGIVQRTLKEMTMRGLVEVQGEQYYILPVLRHFLVHPSLGGLMDANEINGLHRALAQLFSMLAQQTMEQIKTLYKADKPLEEKPTNRFLTMLASQQVDLLHRGTRQALAQDELALAGGMLQDFVNQLAGRVPPVRIAAYARQFRRMLDNLIFENLTELEKQIFGACYGVVGGAYQEVRAWRDALSSYQKAFDVCQATGQHQHIGTAYHQVGIVYQQQRDWDNALKNYREAIDWKEKTGQHHQLGGTYHQVGRVYEESGDIEAAADWYQRTVENLHEYKSHELIIALRSAMRVVDENITEDGKRSSLHLYIEKLANANSEIAALIAQLQNEGRDEEGETS